MDENGVPAPRLCGSRDLAVPHDERPPVGVDGRAKTAAQTRSQRFPEAGERSLHRSEPPRVRRRHRHVEVPRIVVDGSAARDAPHDGNYQPPSGLAVTLARRGLRTSEDHRTLRHPHPDRVFAAAPRRLEKGFVDRQPDRGIPCFEVEAESHGSPQTASAWYELRTRGPEVTRSNPSARASFASSSNSSGGT
jgi:hypothetical protein